MFPVPSLTSPIARPVIGKLDENGLQRQAPEPTTATNAIQFEGSKKTYFYNYLLF